MATNKQVIEAFRNQQRASAGRLSTDGHRLYSYDLMIGIWYGGKPLILDYTSTGDAFRSMTTSQHVGLAKREIPSANVFLVELARKLEII